MYIKKIKNAEHLRNVDQEIPTKEGAVQFTATLSDEEVRFVMEVGINILYAHGAIPFLSNDIYPATIQPTTKTKQ